MLAQNNAIIIMIPANIAITSATGKIKALVTVSNMNIINAYLKLILLLALAASFLVTPTPIKSIGRTINKKS
jgi:uncharacterized membrane protein (DUF485 family)